jgi:hypothetical protein
MTRAGVRNIFGVFDCLFAEADHSHDNVSSLSGAGFQACHPLSSAPATFPAAKCRGKNKARRCEHDATSTHPKRIGFSYDV